MRLLTLRLRNFKGIKEFDLAANGCDVSIFGDNATGKTTLYDAFLWLLFDKDSSNRKDFAIKTLDAQGREIHNLEHEVEAVLDLGGTQLTLRKVYSEKWTKKRGSATSEFTGHTTDYFIDGVPAKKKEYDEKINSIVDENVFKLLTNPAYFNEQLHWEERRKTLLEVCGDLTDGEVIASDKALAKLPAILQGRTLEDHRKVIQSKRTEINKELQKIPVRIDEATRNLPDISKIDAPAALDSDIEKARKAIEDKQAEITRIEQGGEVAELRKQLADLNVTMVDIESKWTMERNKQISPLMIKLNGVRSEIDSKNRAKATAEKEIQDNLETCEYLAKKVNSHRDKWFEINEQAFTFEQEDTCPTCGQFLPAEQLDEARNKAVAAFNQTKAQRLKDIADEGKGFASQIAKLHERNAELAESAKVIEAETVKLEAEEVRISAEIDKLQNDMKGYASAPEYQKAVTEKEAVQAKIDQLKQDSASEVGKVKAEIASLRPVLEHFEYQKQSLALHEQGKERIAELEEQEKRLAKEFEQLESELHLTEQFVKAKVSLLEEKINSKFEMARFKLFVVQINGGITECCETLYNGVPYSSGLNNAARINVGLDIISTLSEHYGFTAPIFVDNAEAVVNLMPVEAQVIRLVVFEGDKTLRVEIEGEQETLFKEVV